MRCSEPGMASRFAIRTSRAAVSLSFCRAACQAAMHDNSRIAVGVAWYRAEEWALLLSLIPDPEVFPRTHAEWLARASETYRELSKQGVAVQKVEVEVRALVAWAQARGRAPDGAARAEYAQHLVAQAAGERGNQYLDN